jgi:hypothetical protein
MNGREADMSAALAEFVALPVADRKAVEAHLSPGERRALEKLFSQASRTGPSRETQAARRDLTQPFSPWMAKRLKKLIEPQAHSHAPHLTKATHEVLTNILSRQASR